MSARHPLSIRIGRMLFTLLLLCLLAVSGQAEGPQEPVPSETVKPFPPADTVSDGAAGWKDVGVDEKCGQPVPPDVLFTDETGRARPLREWVDRPTLVLPVFFSCPGVCPTLLSNLAGALNKVPMTPGRDFRVLTLSFDPEDTPEAARRTKAIYMDLLTLNTWQENDWRFLTGDSAAIDRFTSAAGYRFIRQASQAFIHPNVLIVLSAKGTVIRYLYGPDFLPFDIAMALTEAAKGTPSLSIRKIVSYCFTFDPDKKTYTFRAMQYIGLLLLLILAGVLYRLLRKKHD